MIQNQMNLGHAPARAIDVYAPSHPATTTTQSSGAASTEAPAIYDLQSHSGLWTRKSGQNTTKTLGGGDKIY
jgi:hypothetical protein